MNRPRLTPMQRRELELEIALNDFIEECGSREAAERYFDDGMTIERLIDEIYPEPDDEEDEE